MPIITKASTIDDVMNQISELNQKVLDLQSQLSAAVTSAVTSGPTARVCLPTTPAWIEVTNPNGGQIFNLNDNIRPTWSGCNIAIGQGAQVWIIDMAIPSMAYSLGSGESSFGSNISHTPSIVNAPSLGTNNFKLKIISTGQISGLTDYSNNTFTINASQIANNTTTETKTTTTSTTTTTATKNPTTTYSNLKQQRGDFIWNKKTCIVNCWLNGQIMTWSSCEGQNMPATPKECTGGPTNRGGSGGLIAQNPTNPFTLALGMQGDEIKAFQYILKNAGYIPLSTKITGSFGSATRSAILKLQQEKSLIKTGVVDSTTRTALYELLKAQETKTKNNVYLPKSMGIFSSGGSGSNAGSRLIPFSVDTGVAVAGGNTLCNLWAYNTDTGNVIYGGTGYSGYGTGANGVFGYQGCLIGGVLQP
ncbi:MAG: peptidoglycan-binding domain-containing protein [Candidatus Paceibacterota bacterium]